MKTLMFFPLYVLSSGCAYMSGFAQAQASRSLFERGYFAEMAADEGYPSPRRTEGVTLIRDITYREGGESKDRAASLLDIVTSSKASAGLRPMVVFVHGGGLNAGAKDDETQVNTNLAIALAQRGYLVLNINHRLVSDMPHPAQAQDMAADRRYLREAGVDPERIRAVFAVSGFFDLHHLSQSFLVRKFIVEPAFGTRSRV